MQSNRELTTEIYWLVLWVWDTEFTLQVEKRRTNQTMRGIRRLKPLVLTCKWGVGELTFHFGELDLEFWQIE